jgi:DNA ligase (NAD+)
MNQSKTKKNSKHKIPSKSNKTGTKSKTRKNYVCKGRKQSECREDSCLWINGKTKKYCRKRIGKAKPKIIKRSVKRAKIKIPDSVNKHIHEFRRKGVLYLQHITEANIGQILELSNRVYRNGMSMLLKDAEYDIIWQYARENYPELPQVNKVGIDVNCSGRMQKLPIYMGSLDKIKNNVKKIESFKNKYSGSYVVSDKLDGISGLYYCKMGERPRLYSRGNGKIGQDLSFLLDKIQGLPPYEEICSRDFVVRGEFIMRNDDYQTHFKDEFRSPRYAVASAIISQDKNTKTNILDKIHFVSYEQIIPRGTPQEQMDRLRQEPNMEVVYNRVMTDKELTNETLSDLLTNRRYNNIYNIDGLVISHNEYYRPPTDGNPKHAFAFKMLLRDQMAESVVTGVEWLPSKHGVLIPKIHIEKVTLSTGSISKIAAYNARYIIDNMIGVGARVVVFRSGDIIPKVLRVIEPAQVPSFPTGFDYEWDNRKINFVLKDISPNSLVKMKRIRYFLHSLGGTYVGESTIQKLYNSGFVTLRQFIEMKPEDILQKKIRGIAKKRAEKIVNTIKNVIERANPIMIIDATGKFGSFFGTKKIYNIAMIYPEAFDISISHAERQAGLLSVKGIGPKLSEKFVNNLDKFYQFITENNIPFPEKIVEYFKKKMDNINKYMVGVKVVFSDIKNNTALENYVTTEGGEIVNVVTVDVTDVVASNPKDDNDKLNMARELCLPIYNVSQFKKKYNITF